MPWDDATDGVLTARVPRPGPAPAQLTVRADGIRAAVYDVTVLSLVDLAFAELSVGPAPATQPPHALVSVSTSGVSPQGFPSILCLESRSVLTVLLFWL